MAYLWGNLLCVLLWVVATNARHFSIVGYDPQDLLSEDRLSKLFNLWCSRHGKLYEKEEEVSKRFQAFKSNLEYIEAHNKLNTSTHWLALNKFADLTNEEFKARFSRKIRKPRTRWPDSHSVSSGYMSGPKAASCEASSSLDWRKRGVVTGVKNQGNCGSCWSFSTTGAIEGINAINTGDLISLSEQELVDCDSTNYGCDGGYMNYAFEWVIQNGGIDTESDYPYIGTQSSCNTAKEERKVVTIDGYTQVADEESAVLCAVVNQPVSVGMVASSLDFQLYAGGIYDGDCSNNPDDIDHAVLIVGYSSEDGVDYWIVKNSWGTDWGLNGYIYIRRNTGIPNGVCAINAEVSYPTKAETSPSPLPSPAVPPPPPPPPPRPPPPPPAPTPVDCNIFFSCSSQETCCCLFQWGQYCLIYGCCELQNAVCCTGSIYCCPADYPICDLQDGLCLQNDGDDVGVEIRKRKRAHYKFPWKKQVDEENTLADVYPSSLRWRGQVA